MEFRKPNRKGGKPQRCRDPLADSDSTMFDPYAVGISKPNSNDARRYYGNSRSRSISRISTEERDKQFHNNWKGRADCDIFSKKKKKSQDSKLRLSQDRNQQENGNFQRDKLKQKNQGEVRRSAKQSPKHPPKNEKMLLQRFLCDTSNIYGEEESDENCDDNEFYLSDCETKGSASSNDLSQEDRKSESFHSISGHRLPSRTQSCTRMPFTDHRRMNIPERKLMSLLNKIFTNYEGESVKVVEEDSDSQTILMKFPSPQNATKARNRFRGILEVYSREIEIEYCSMQEVDVTQEKVVPKSYNKEAPESNDPKAELNMTPTWVIVTGDITVKEEHIKQSIFTTKLAHLFFQYSTDSSEGCRCCIQYSSQHQAKKVVKALRNDLGNRIRAEIQKSNLVASRQGYPADRIAKEFLALRDLHIEQHKLAKIEMINQAKLMKGEAVNVMQSKISLMDNYLDEFQIASNQLFKRFSDPTADRNSLKMALITECHRLHRRLPVYGARKRILMNWKKEKITIVTGPSGIGKSTEIPQYLLEESLDMTGSIAVVEPYRISAVAHAHTIAKQYGSSVGTVVGYKDANNSKEKMKAKIIYMTDETLLNEYSKDRELKNYYCIVLDELQERSDSTEVLLPLLRNLAKSRVDLKIVLLSTYENANSLMEFFSPCGKVPITTKMFPVQLIWQPKIKKWTCSEAVIKTVKQILNEYETGDILAFVPHPSDASFVEAMLKQQNNNSQLFIQALHSESFLEDVNYCLMENDKRKVVIATSLCQNALSIKNIKFVIDCGFTKNVKGCRILNNFISKTEAQWRMIAAGFKENGKCYRLYSKDDFERTASKETEWNPHFPKLVLQILKLGFSLSTEFPFLDKVDKEALTLARRELEDLNAVEFRGLTIKGQCMAALNVCPRLALLIIDTLDDNDQCCIAIFLAAVMSLKSVYPCGDIKQQKVIGVPEERGEILSLTALFNEWFGLNDNKRIQWYVKNKVDKSLIIKIKDNVMRLHAAITNEMGCNILLKSIHEQKYSSIEKTLLECWKENLAFLENSSTNTYICLKTGRKISPLSACQISSQQKFVVFDKVVNDGNGDLYMLNTIPLAETLVKMAVDNKVFGIEKLDTDIKCLPLAQAKMEGILHQERDKFLQENFEYNIGKNVGVCAKIRASGRISDIVFPNDSCSVNGTETESKNDTGYDETTLKSAIKATSCPNGKKNSKLEVLVYWTRRKNLGMAILNFKSEKQSILLALQALLEQTLKSSPIEKNVVVADPSANRIILKNMNRLVSKKELISFVKSICWKTGAKLRNIEMAQEPSFSTSEEDLKTSHRKLQELIYHYVNDSAVELKCLKPQESDEVWKAFLKVKDPRLGDFVTKVLNEGQQIDGIPLKMEVSLTATIQCTSNIFIATEERLVNTLKQINSESLEEGNELNVSVHFGNGGQDVIIEIKAYNRNDFITNSYHISKLIQGEKITIGDLRIHVFQECMEGRKMIDQIMKEEEVLILVDGFSKCLYLWGNINSVPKTKEKLEKFIQEKALQNTQLRLFYFGDSPGFLCFLVEKFGPKFIELCEVTGCQDIDVDLHNHNLQLFGSDTALQQTTLKLHDMKRKFIDQQSSSDEICSVCLGKGVTRKKHYLLAYCGHVYCMPCISVILAHCKIPLRCYHKNCNAPMVRLDFSAFQKEFQPLLCDLLNTEVRQFVQANSQQMSLCPVPLCGGVLKASQENIPITCPLCSNAICTSCQALYHYGQTCSDFQALMKKILM